MVVALVGMGVGFTSCSDDDEETTGGGNGAPAAPSASVEALESGAVTSADFVLDATSISELAYKAVKAAEDTVNAGVMSSDLLFANADAVIAVNDGKDTITVAGLEGNTAYNIYVAVKTLEGEFLNETADMISVTTAEYGDQILTMISTTPFSVKFHVNVPDTTNWIMNLASRDTYEQMKMYFGQSDFDFLGSVGNVHYQGPQTIEIKDGDFWYQEVSWDGVETYDYFYSIKPGEAYVLLLSAANYDLVPFSWPETWRWMPDGYVDFGEGGGDDWWGPLSNARNGMNLGEYTETCTDENVFFNREYAKQYLWTNPAATPAEGEGVEVTLKKLTERTAIFEMVPSESCLSYHVLPLSHEDYEMLCTFVGEAGMQAYALNYGEPMAGGNEYVMSGLTVGATYHMLVTGLFEENGAVQTFYHETFVPQESTKEVPVLEVTAVSEKNTHDMVYFNIKAPNKDAYAIKLIANYVKDWIPEINSGFSYEDMVETYGQMLYDEEIALVNSDEGYEISYPSFEESDTRLAVISYNDEEKSSEAYTADSRSTSIPAKDKVASTLYADLEGNWVLNYWDTRNYYENSDNSGEYRKFNATLTTNADFGPATFEDWKNDASYTTVLEALGNDEARVKALFDEYKSVAAHYTAKYEGQNQILGLNFPYGQYTYAANQNVFTPWDLFTSEYYSAYDCAQLFYDFGPKVMFEVVGENELVLKSDVMMSAPMANFDGGYYMVGIGEDGYLPSCEFPVTVTANKDSLIVGPAEVDGKLYYPGVIRYYSADYAATQNGTNRELIYTRGTLEGAQLPAATKAFSIDEVLKANKSMYGTNELIPAQLPVVGKRSAKVVNAPKLKRVEGKLFDLNAKVQSLKK